MRRVFFDRFGTIRTVWVVASMACIIIGAATASAVFGPMLPVFAGPAQAGNPNDPETTIHSRFYRTQSGVSYEVVRIPGFGLCVTADAQGTAMVCK